MAISRKITSIYPAAEGRLAGSPGPNDFPFINLICLSFRFSDKEFIICMVCRLIYYLHSIYWHIWISGLVGQDHIFFAATFSRHLRQFHAIWLLQGSFALRRRCDGCWCRLLDVGSGIEVLAPNHSPDEGRQEHRVHFGGFIWSAEERDNHSHDYGDSSAH